jgi:YD repeat-containing protein
MIARLSFAAILLGTSLASAGGTARDDDHPHRSSTGSRYKYDLDRPAERLRYKYDPAAKLRDRIDPRVRLDRALGDSFGGRCAACED